MPIDGKLSRIDVETGARTPVPFTARVQAEIAPRVYTPVRVEDGASVRARLIRWPIALARRHAPRLQRAQPPVRDGSARAAAPRLVDAPRRRPPRPKASSCRSGRQTGASITYVTWTTTGGHIKRVAAAGGASDDADAARRLLPRSRPTRPTAASSSSSPAPPPISSTRSCSIRRRPTTTMARPARLAASTRRTRSRSGACPSDGGASTLVASAQNGRDPQFVRNDGSRVYLTTPRGLQSITMDGFDRRTHLRIQGAGPGNNPPGAPRDPPVARRHAGLRQPAEPALRGHRAAHRTRDDHDPDHRQGRQHARAGQAPVARKAATTCRGPPTAAA